MAEALISVILEQLASISLAQIEQEVRLVVGLKKEVAKLTQNFKAIQVVLEDAEQRQVKEADVRFWLDKLKDVSYDMDDVLDEWNTEIQKQLEKEGPNALVSKQTKVCFCIPTSWLAFCQVSRVSLRRAISLKIKDLNESLTSIADERKNYNFQPAERRIEPLERQITTSLVGKTFGRANEKEILVSKLLSESSQQEVNPLVIPLVGMGGIGKTALAQLAYNDAKVQTNFDTRIWVCVSDPFDEIKVAKSIIEGLKLNNIPASNELQTLLQFINESIKSKKFLLVLDDVWTEDSRKWEQLYLSLQSGSMGSRIVVTTRKEEVVRMMRPTAETINLKELGEENSWLLFSHFALEHREINERRVLEPIGREIVKKCKGLPLAAKTLGGLMRNKKTRAQWEGVLNSKIWELGFVVEQQIFQPLLLSYYDLAHTIKRCLLYCVIFPKDTLISKDNLIELWMSQNYLHDFSGSKEKATVGEIYFENLAMRSFFQDFQEDILGNIIECKMHDIVHDFLQFLTKNEFVIMEAKVGGEKMELSGDKVRHLTLMLSHEGPFPISLNNGKKLRTLTTFDSKITILGPKLFSQLKCIRSLNLSHNLIKEVPKEVGELVHLRYLDLSYNDNLQELPDTLCDLFNLQTLLLKYCYRLEKLPENMGKLRNLQHLHVRGSPNAKLPKSIASLTSLRTLDEVNIYEGEIGNNEGLLKLSDLKNMADLSGSLRIVFQEHPKEGGSEGVERAQILVNKKHLRRLYCDWEDSARRPEQMNIHEQVLIGLEPHTNLESLVIRRYIGRRVEPTWLMSLNSLRNLRLFDCINCEVLPANLGKLASLEFLVLSSFPKVKKVGVEFLGMEKTTQTSTPSSSPLILFPNLKQLEFIRMDEWEEWEGVAGWSEEEEDSQKIAIMPRLSSLEIFACGKLKVPLPKFLLKTPLREFPLGRTAVTRELLLKLCAPCDGPISVSKVVCEWEEETEEVRD